VCPLSETCSCTWRWLLVELRFETAHTVSVSTVKIVLVEEHIVVCLFVIILYSAT
jgi:hypothetical protein